MKKILVVLLILTTSTVFADLVNYKIGPRLQHQLNKLSKSARPMSQKKIKVIVVIEADYLSELPPEVVDELAGIVVDLGGHLGNNAFNNVQVWIPEDKITELAEWEKVQFIKMPTTPGTMGVKSEGLGIGNITNWQNNGLTGAGVKVGVLDTGFKDAYGLFGSELPADTVFEHTGSTAAFNSGTHGTSCAEIVHDVAPDAKLFLINAADLEVDYAIAVDWLRQQKVDIISSSIGRSSSIGFCYFLYNLINSSSDKQNYFATQMQSYINHLKQIDQTTSAAVAAGVTWAQAANNSGMQRWKGMFNDLDNDKVHNFSNGKNYNKLSTIVGEDVYVIMSWGLDGFTTDNDYDLIIIDEDGNTVTSSVVDQANSHIGVEACKLTPEQGKNYYIKIQKYWATAQIQEITLLVGSDSAQLEDFTPEETVTLGTPCDNPDVITVGAVPYNNPYVIEKFSGQGPGGNNIIKPDIVAPDGVSTVSHGGAFYGTSAAAPHVAGVCALVKQMFPKFGPTQIKQYLEQNALDLGVPGKDNVFGSGLVRVPVIAPTPAPTPTPPVAVFIAGFDKAYYLAGKLAALQLSDLAWTKKNISFLETFLANCGFTPESHYSKYGWQEGLSPNQYFNHSEYITAKATAMYNAGGYLTVEAAKVAFNAVWKQDAYQHYLLYGAAEGVNPSNTFDESQYLTDKLNALQVGASSSTQWAGKTIADLRSALAYIGMTTLDHYLHYGQYEGLSVTPVPEGERVN
jgi:subtilisin family serine protease